MTDYKPSRVYASVNNNNQVRLQNIPTPNSSNFPGQSLPNMTEAMQRILASERSDRMIKVTAVGEVSLPPDRCRVTVKIHSQKDNVQDVKNSVQRRLDYVVQTFQNNNIKVRILLSCLSLSKFKFMYCQEIISYI